MIRDTQILKTLKDKKSEVKGTIGEVARRNVKNPYLCLGP